MAATPATADAGSAATKAADAGSAATRAAARGAGRYKGDRAGHVQGALGVRSTAIVERRERRYNADALGT